MSTPREQKFSLIITTVSPASTARNDTWEAFSQDAGREYTICCSLLLLLYINTSHGVQVRGGHYKNISKVKGEGRWQL
jgi:hypothetical protein